MKSKKAKSIDYEKQIKFSDNTAVFEKDILKENQQKVSYLAKLFNYVFSSARLMCSVILALAIILSILQPVTAFIWGKYIDKANYFANNMSPTSTQIIALIGLALWYWLIKFLSDILNRYMYGGEDIERISKVQENRLQEKFQAKLFKKISKLYPDYMEVPRINDIIKRSFDVMGSEWSSLQRGVIIEGYVIIAKVISVIMVAASLYIFHPLLCLIVLIAPIPTLYTTYIGNKLNFKFSRDNSEIMRKAIYYQGVLLGNSIKEVKALNLFDFFFSKWKVLMDNYVIREKKNQRNVFILGIISSIIANISTVVANIFAILLMTQGKLTIGALGAVLALISTLMESTTQLLSSIATFISKKNEAAQFFELIELDEQMVRESIDEKKIINIDKLEVHDLTYRYPLTDEYRIKNVNFEIKKGEKVAFVGENGVGKTTFVKLLTGMLQPTSGEIFYNGQNIVNMYYADRYNSLSYMFQEPVHFNTFTIADNVHLGDVDKEQNENQIESALKFAGVENVDRNAMIGKDIGGIDLSGGQWQKVAIARAYYRNRDFIVLDEPTSNLDPLSEAEIFKEYMSMAEGKTLIIVTHRISITALADRVVVFKDGKIVEDGVHDDLLLKNGEYARLYYAQSQWYNR